MARSARGKRPALPADAATRLHRTVSLRLTARLGDLELIDQVGALCVPWLLGARDRVRFDRAKRLRLASEADRLIKRLARSLAQMASRTQAFGQQAAQAASKTLRAVRTRRIDMDGLLSLEAGYRSLRQAYRQRNGSPVVHAPAETMMLDEGAMVATRVVSEQLMTVLGRQAHNCLASPLNRKAYAAEMKDGRTAFWRIDPTDQPDQPVWVIAVSLETGDITELEHVGGIATIPRDRDALLEFLTAHAKVGREWETELSPFALSPDLIEASQVGQTRSIGALFAGSAWSFEIGIPGVLVAMPTDGPALLQDWLITSWMLHGARTSAGTTLSIHVLPCRVDGDWTDDSADTDDDDGEIAPRRPAAGPRTMMELEIRLALRKACRASPALRKACREAFAAESPLFIQDWFGIVPRAVSAAAKIVGRG